MDGTYLFRLLGNDVSIDELAIVEGVLEQVDALQHVLALLRGERGRDVYAYVPLHEDVDDHPICLVLSLFVGGVVCRQPQELKYIG